MQAFVKWLIKEAMVELLLKKITIWTSERDEILNMYMVTPTTTGSPVWAKYYVRTCMYVHINIYIINKIVSEFFIRKTYHDAIGNTTKGLILAN